MSSRKEYIEAVKSSFISLAKKQVMAQIFVALPFMSWGPLAPLAGMLVDWVLRKAVEGAETGIFFAYVDFRVAAQNKDFTEAAIANHRAQLNGTQEDKDAAEKKLVEAFDRFIKLNRV